MRGRRSAGQDESQNDELKQIGRSRLLKELPKVAVVSRFVSGPDLSTVVLLKVGRAWREAQPRLVRWMARLRGRDAPYFRTSMANFETTRVDTTGGTRCLGFYETDGLLEIAVRADELPTVEVGDIVEFEIVGVDFRDELLETSQTLGYAYARNTDGFMGLWVLRTYALRLALQKSEGMTAAQDVVIARLPVAVLGVATFADGPCRPLPTTRTSPNRSFAQLYALERARPLLPTVYTPAVPSTAIVIPSSVAASSLPSGSPIPPSPAGPGAPAGEVKMANQLRADLQAALDKVREASRATDDLTSRITCDASPSTLPAAGRKVGPVRWPPSQVSPRPARIGRANP